MEILILILAVFGVFLTTRYISFACTKWYLFSLRDSICIERSDKSKRQVMLLLIKTNAQII